MTVQINPIQPSDDGSMDLLFKAIDVATRIYGAKLDKEQAESLRKMNEAKYQQEQASAATKLQKEDQEKQAEKERQNEQFVASAGKDYQPGQGGIAIPRLARSMNLPETATFIPRKQPSAPKDPKASEAEKTTALFGKRMEQSDQILAGLENASDFNISGLSSTFQRSSLFPERFKSDKIKSYEQAQRNFINAVLRKESGASISPSEFENAIKQYFPQDNDSPDLIAQKQENRALAIEAMKIGSGEYWNKLATPSIKPKTQAEGGTAIAAPSVKPPEDMSAEERAAELKRLRGGK